MKFLFSLTLLCILVAATTAATAIGYFKDPKHPGKCVIEGEVYSPGDHNFADSCGKLTCTEDGTAEFFTCPAMGTDPEHKFGKPLYPKAGYPKCCEREIVKA